MASKKNEATEKCFKCNGSGQYRSFGICFSCKGTGSVKASRLTVEMKPVATIKTDCANGQHDWIFHPAGKSCEQCGEKVYN